MYRHIVFDIDGTLIDTAECILVSLQEVLLEKFGSTPPKEKLVPYIGLPAEIALDDLHLDRKEGHRRWMERMAANSHLIHPFPEIQELLEELKKRGIKVGIATSRCRKEYENGFAQLPIAAYFPISICTDDTTLHKPHGEPVVRCMERNGCKPEETIYLGDTKYDMMCAKDAGATAVLAMWGALHPEECPADIRLEHPLQMLDLL